jgi:cobalt-zinc-cadmium efflux system outer membrane protein
VLLAAALVVRTAAADPAWPTLEDALSKARMRAPAILQAEGELGRAAAAGVGARMSSLGNPYLEVIADRGMDAAHAGLQIQAQLFLPLEIAGQRSARIHEATAQVQWRQAARREAEGQAQGAVASAYGGALIAVARILVAERAESAARTELAWFTARAQVGDATIVDRNLAEAEVSRWGQLRVEAQVRLTEAREALAVLTGLPVVEPPEAIATPDPPDLRTSSPDAYVRAVLERAPALQSIDQEGVYWDRQIERAEADRSPPVNLIVSGGRGELGDARLGGGLGWAFPVVRRNEGEIARAHHEKQRTRTLRASYAVLLEARARAVFDRFTLTKRADATLDAEGLPAAERVVDATNAAFKAGKLELVRVLNARRDLATARSRRLDLDEAAWRAYGEMISLVGERP